MKNKEEQSDAKLDDTFQAKDMENKKKKTSKKEDKKSAAEHLLKEDKKLSKLAKSFGEEVAEAMEKHKSIEKAAKEAYKEGKAEEKHAKKSDMEQKYDSSRFEMLPSEKAKMDKKNKHDK